MYQDEYYVSYSDLREMIEFQNYLYDQIKELKNDVEKLVENCAYDAKK